MSDIKEYKPKRARDYNLDILYRLDLIAIALGWEEPKESYLVDANGARHLFELENTPIENFCGVEQHVFVNGVEVMKNSIRKIYFGTSYKAIPAIGGFFINGYWDVEVNVENLTGVKSIGRDFFRGSFITQFVAKGFSAVETLGENSFSNIATLKVLDLSGFQNLKEIGFDCIRSLTALEELNLKGLTSLISVGDFFLYGLDKIKDIDLSGFSALKKTGNNFLSLNRLMTELDLSSMENLESMGMLAISNNSLLKKIDLSPLVKLKTLGNSGITYNIALEEIILAGTNIETIGTMFARGCTSLKIIRIGSTDFSNCTVGANAFYSCPNTSDCIIYADSQAIGEIFKAKFGRYINNWTIVANG